MPTSPTAAALPVRRHPTAFVPRRAGAARHHVQDGEGSLGAGVLKTRLQPPITKGEHKHLARPALHPGMLPAPAVPLTQTPSPGAPGGGRGGGGLAYSTLVLKRPRLPALFFTLSLPIILNQQARIQRLNSENSDVALQAGGKERRRGDRRHTPIVAAARSELNTDLCGAPVRSEK